LLISTELQVAAVIQQGRSEVKAKFPIFWVLDEDEDAQQMMWLRIDIVLEIHSIHPVPLPLMVE
jgi:hypothetical protein